jgi:hypothetical protein
MLVVTSVITGNTPPRARMKESSGEVLNSHEDYDLKPLVEYNGPKASPPTISSSILDMEKPEHRTKKEESGVFDCYKPKPACPLRVDMTRDKMILAYIEMRIIISNDSKAE